MQKPVLKQFLSGGVGIVMKAVETVIAEKHNCKLKLFK
jgi:hypothetical protein